MLINRENADDIFFIQQSKWKSIMWHLLNITLRCRKPLVHVSEMPLQMMELKKIQIISNSNIKIK